MSGIVVSHRTFINATPEKLFAMLTSGAGWERWFASTATVDPRVGGAIHFEWKNFGPDHYCAHDGGTVKTYEENVRFDFTWVPGAHETLVSIAFSPRGDGCLLSVTETGYDRSEDEDVEVALHVACGWGEALTLLKFYVEHGTIYGLVPAENA